jgi:hypothetical protein
MNRNKSFRKPGAASVALGAAFLLTQMKGEARPLPRQEQQQSESQQQTPPPPTSPENAQPASQPTAPAAKQKKVWTEEDVILLRTPADNYQVEKEAREAAAKQAALQAALKPEKQPTPEPKLPATAEETEKKLKETQVYIQEETDALDKLRKDLLDAPAELRAHKQEEIDRVNRLLESSERDLRALEEHLQTFHEKPQEAPPAAPEPPPPGS